MVPVDVARREADVFALGLEPHGSVRTSWLSAERVKLGRDLAARVQVVSGFGLANDHKELTVLALALVRAVCLPILSVPCMGSTASINHTRFVTQICFPVLSLGREAICESSCCSQQSGF